MRVLLVDDAPLSQALFARVAAAAGIELVVSAAELSSALTLVREQLPDAVVLDGRLPGGVTANLVALARPASGLPLFVVAALAETALVREALAAGAAGIVRRPYRATQLRAVLGPS